MPRYPVSVASSVILAVNLINLNGLKILCINKTFSRHCQLLLQRNSMLIFSSENNGHVTMEEDKTSGELSSPTNVNLRR